MLRRSLQKLIIQTEINIFYTVLPAPQVPGPIFFQCFSAELLSPSNISLDTFANDTTIMATNEMCIQKLLGKNVLMSVEFNLRNE